MLLKRTEQTNCLQRLTYFANDFDSQSLTQLRCNFTVNVRIIKTLASYDQINLELSRSGCWNRLLGGTSTNILLRKIGYWSSPSKIWCPILSRKSLNQSTFNLMPKMRSHRSGCQDFRRTNILNLVGIQILYILILKKFL